MEMEEILVIYKILEIFFQCLEILNKVKMVIKINLKDLEMIMKIFLDNFSKI